MRAFAIAAATQTRWSQNLKRRKTLADYMNPSDYKPNHIDREYIYMFCPHCGTKGIPSNRYLWRCTSGECGRYF